MRPRTLQIATPSSGLESAGQRTSLEFILFAIYLCSLAFEGPLRHLLSLAHLSTIIYARDALAAATIIKHIASRIIRRESLIEPVTIGCYAIVVHAALSIWLSIPIPSILFSIKIFTGLLYGLAISRQLEASQYQVKILFLIIFFGSCIGVILNYLLGAFPWEGDTYETAFGTTQTTKVWWAGGERRLSGFTRASYTAAMCIGLTGILLMSRSNKKIYITCIFMLGCASIYLTTSKGMVASFFVAGIWILLTKDTPVTQSTGKLIFITVATLVVAIPLLANIYNGNPTEIRSAPPLLSSFWDRITQSWPETFAQLKANFGYVLGKGLGGTGISIRMSAYNPNQFVPIDNIFWYMYATFGAPALLYYFYAISRIANTTKYQPDIARQMLAAGIAIMGYGLTSVMFEDTFFSILFGAILAWPNHHKPPAHAAIN